MGSIVISQRRYTDDGITWMNWKPAAEQNNQDMVPRGGQFGDLAYVYSVDLSLSTGELLINCGISINFIIPDPYARPYCYLYNFDPTVNNPQNPPDGHIGFTSALEYSSGRYLISFPGLDVRSSGKLYFWIGCDGDPTTEIAYFNVNDYQPSAIGSFELVPMSLSVDTPTVSTGSNLGITVSNGAGTNLTAVVKYGNTELTRKSFSSGSTTIQCSRTWFDSAGVTLLQSMTLGIEVLGGSQSMADTFTLKAGSDMKPTVGTPTVTLVQPSSASGFPNTWLANISKAKVTAAVTKKTNSAISTVKLSFDGNTVNMTYNSGTGRYEATTEAPITGNTTFTVTATDQRGMSGSKTASVSGVVPYTKPSVTVTSIFRCNSGGTAESGGAYWAITAVATYYSALSGNSATMTAGIKNSTAYTITSGVRSILSGMNNSKSAYTVVVTVTDSVGGTSKVEITLKGIERNVVVRKGPEGTYLGVGKAPGRSTGYSTVEVDQNGRFLMGSIPASAFSLLVGQQWSTSSDLTGASFNKDFHAVDFVYTSGTKNAAAAFRVTPQDYSQWSNIPGLIQPADWFVGVRMVYLLDIPVEGAIIVIFEMVPYLGRIWFCRIRGDGTASAWNYHEPTGSV